MCVVTLPVVIFTLSIGDMFSPSTDQAEGKGSILNIVPNVLGYVVTNVKWLIACTVVYFMSSLHEILSDNLDLFAVGVIVWTCLKYIATLGLHLICTTYAPHVLCMQDVKNASSTTVCFVWGICMRLTLGRKKSSNIGISRKWQQGPNQSHERIRFPCTWTQRKKILWILWIVRVPNVPSQWLGSFNTGSH